MIYRVRSTFRNSRFILSDGIIIEVPPSIKLGEELVEKRGLTEQTAFFRKLSFNKIYPSR